MAQVVVRLVHFGYYGMFDEDGPQHLGMGGLTSWRGRECSCICCWGGWLRCWGGG